MAEDIEQQLVKKFIEGDERAFNDLVKRYQQNIYWHARRMVGNHLDADEIAQQVIIVLYKKLSTFKYKSTLKTWIYKITQTSCLNLLKKRNVRHFLNLENENTAALISSEDIILKTEDKDKIERLNRYLEELPLKQKRSICFKTF